MVQMSNYVSDVVGIMHRLAKDKVAIASNKLIDRYFIKIVAGKPKAGDIICYDYRDELGSTACVVVSTYKGRMLDTEQGIELKESVLHFRDFKVSELYKNVCVNVKTLRL